jgi:hypothetical protein
VLGVRVRRSSLARLDGVAAGLGVDRSEAARRALAAGLELLERLGPAASRHGYIPGPEGRCGALVGGSACNARRLDGVHG